jgi:hypothetical protein
MNDDETRRMGIIAVLGIIGIFIYPWVILAGVVVLGIPFALLWLKRRR